MPITERADGALIHHASHGSGFPVLLLGPTGADGATDEPGLFGTVRALDAYRVITADRRHTGGSTAPLAPFSYAEAAADQLAVLDDLGADAVHVVASGDGTALALRLAHDAPARIASLVLQAPVGLDSTNTVGSFHAPYDEAMRLARAEGLEGVVAAAVRDGRFGAEPGAGPFAQQLHDDPAFREHLHSLRRERYIAALVRHRDGVWPDGSPYFSVSEEWARTCDTPLLILPGADERHPEGVAKALAADARRAQLLDPGHDAPENRARTAEIVTRFLTEHTPRESR
ncbi:pimeloyl-ACP methyl ester carboxylesterase [Streptomyces sp. CZ24]|uniref:alpha/beta fold hydrolase n=1 Tax=Streptomyces sp. M10 TaxID=412968 RepID=UPI00068BBBC1|nr:MULTISPECIES: alpha/beta hydrolase [unclassified Streptomyces]MDH6193351.1 pimeloyl-ACP methyl ester carboxylesterase [Streptomyces sp. CZ24]